MIPAQSRAARELLGLTQEHLADMADLSLSTIQEFENGRSVDECLVATIEVALEAAGVEFRDDNGELCVCLKKRQ
ncbi:helix-turn-helix transcriptional regulator [Methylocystis echinoides]|uniref:helix-turn-helix domain-containing protein n=1 Tax=Methylocystis echinoides TaxID=29468 RepID=UPI0034379F56